MQKVLIIVGPTAIGKTNLGIELAQSFGGEIISGDSMQIYQEVAIGTAKPTKEELEKVAHHLINERSVFEEYSVKEFMQLARAAIGEIAERRKLPIIVGGTGFYINALINGLKLGEAGEYDSPVEEEYEKLLANEGQNKLWELLNQKDPLAAQNIPRQNERRVLRALSVIKRSNKLFSTQEPVGNSDLDVKLIGLNTSRSVLYDRINERVDVMVKAGLVDEAKYMFLNREQLHQVKQAIGYKEFFPYFLDEQDLETAIAKVKQASRKYAKRQLTYFKNQLSVSWYDPLDLGTQLEEKVSLEVREWLNNDKI